MSEQVSYFNTRPPIRRVLFALPIALLIVGAWFSVRWYIGNTIAEYLNTDDNALETAQLAVRLAPDDPFAHWQLAEMMQRLLPADQSSAAITEYERATLLSPNDYRFWLSLGRALEQSGNTQTGEQAMRRAVELAPSYAMPHWYLGNLLLRGGKNSGAFAEFRRATEADQQLRPQVFTLVTKVLGRDMAAVKNALASGEERAQFSRFLIVQNQVDDAVNLWSELDAKDKAANRSVGEELVMRLLDGKHYRQAMAVRNALIGGNGQSSNVGDIIDGGFERGVSSNNRFFGWELKSAQQAQATIDQNTHHEGSRSLRVQFQARSNVDAIPASQIVVVAPNTQYELKYFVKSSKLESAGLPVIDVSDTATGTGLVTSQPAPAEDSDWQAVSLVFKTGATTEAITIRMTRAGCGDIPTCPIFGTVWYDDFILRVVS